MFTGIIRHLGKIIATETTGTNLTLTVESDITSTLKIDESVAHNGICLTVTSTQGNRYTVDAIKETIDKTTIGEWKASDIVNLETAMTLQDRLDGHIVQGHVDGTAQCLAIVEKDGSWEFSFKSLAENFSMVEKGSVCLNGTSLTCFNVNRAEQTFSVAIIPYTYDNTSIQYLKVGSVINIEYDMMGKYVLQYLEAYRN